MTVDEWMESYRPVVNPKGESGLTVEDKCYTFETYGEEFEFVKKAVRENPKCVWTLLECDGEQYIVDGFHTVNRMGYCVTESAFEGERLEICLND